MLVDPTIPVAALLFQIHLKLSFGALELPGFVAVSDRRDGIEPAPSRRLQEYVPEAHSAQMRDVADAAVEIATLKKAIAPRIITKYLSLIGKM